MKNILLLALALFFSCKNSQVSTAEEISIDAIAKKELKTAYERKDLGEYSLCYSVSKMPTEKRKTVVVINNTNGLVLFGPKSMNADVDWHAEGRLIIKEYPEVIKDKNSDETFTYYYDVLKKKKVSTKL